MSELPQEQAPHGVQELVSRAGALGIEGLSSVLDAVSDPVKFGITKDAIALAEKLADPAFAEIPDRELLVGSVQGVAGDPEKEAYANGVYELVGATRPDRSVDEPDSVTGGRRGWIRPTVIPGVGIFEGFNKSDNHFYVNFSRRAEQDKAVV